jgi:gas vesicle protein
MMRDNDEGPYIVIERESGGGIGSFVLGALVGAGLALLFAPKSGAETQEDGSFVPPPRSASARLRSSSRSAWRS